MEGMEYVVSWTNCHEGLSHLGVETMLNKLLLLETVLPRQGNPTDYFFLFVLFLFGLQDRKLSIWKYIFYKYFMQDLLDVILSQEKT